MAYLTYTGAKVILTGNLDSFIGFHHKFNNYQLSAKPSLGCFCINIIFLRCYHQLPDCYVKTSRYIYIKTMSPPISIKQKSVPNC